MWSVKTTSSSKRPEAAAAWMSATSPSITRSKRSLSLSSHWVTVLPSYAATVQIGNAFSRPRSSASVFCGWHSVRPRA